MVIRVHFLCIQATEHQLQELQTFGYEHLFAAYLSVQLKYNCPNSVKFTFLEKPRQRNLLLGEFWMLFILWRPPPLSVSFRRLDANAPNRSRDQLCPPSLAADWLAGKMK